MAEEKSGKVTVQEGCYIGKKWFLKIPYKVIETDVKFCDDTIHFHQGSGFASGKNNKSQKVIRYSEISHVTANSKISTPNTIFAAICGILTLVTQMWALLVVVAIVLFMGTTAVVTISLINGLSFEIPTEFKSEADELKVKIDTAIKQAKE